MDDLSKIIHFFDNAAALSWQLLWHPIRAGSNLRISSLIANPKKSNSVNPYAYYSICLLVGTLIAFVAIPYMMPTLERAASSSNSAMFKGRYGQIGYRQLNLVADQAKSSKINVEITKSLVWIIPALIMVHIFGYAVNGRGSSSPEHKKHWKYLSFIYYAGLWELLTGIYVLISAIIFVSIQSGSSGVFLVEPFSVLMTIILFYFSILFGLSVATKAKNGFGIGDAIKFTLAMIFISSFHSAYVLLGLKIF